MITPRQMLVEAGMYSVKCPFAMTPTRIVVHNTANDASANNEISYMRTNPNEVSFHFAVDDKEVVQGVPLNRNTWNAGDGNGKGNREGISIEICYSKSGGARFDAAEALAAKFIAQLLKERGWGVERVTKHQDYNNKYCPHRTLDKGWTRFLNMVKASMVPASAPAKEYWIVKPLPGYATKENALAGKNSTRTVVAGKYIMYSRVGNAVNVTATAGVAGIWIDEAKNVVDPPKAASAPAKKSNEAIAKEVIDGKWGNGEDRKKRLKAAGYDPVAVQAVVNRLLR